jgi:hypothetical protein
MNKTERINLHKKIAQRLKAAAECHEKAAKMLEGDQMKEACCEGMTAFGHILHAKDLIISAAKQLADKPCCDERCEK